MNVFLSWSGSTSHELAKLLRQFLDDMIIPKVHAFLSDADIQPGERWFEVLSGALEDTQMGIVCLTPENLERPWILFEAGAISKSVERGLVCTCCLGMEPNAVTGPLAQFQGRKADRAGIFDIMRTINTSAGDLNIAPDKLQAKFDAFWTHWKCEQTLAKLWSMSQATAIAKSVISTSTPELLAASLRNLQQQFRELRQAVEQVGVRQEQIETHGIQLRQANDQRYRDLTDDLESVRKAIEERCRKPRNR